MGADLPEKPEVIYISGIVSLDVDTVVGKLLRVWSWFDKHTTDGNAVGVTYAFLDRLVSVTGFAEAMQFAGWLEQRGSILHMPNFDYHTSESAKKRALTAKRVKRSRNAKGNASVTLVALPEKRREEVKEKEAAPPDGGPVWSECLTILTEQKLSEKTARSFLGMLCRDYEEPDIVAAVKASVGKADASAYIRGVLKGAVKKGQPRRVAI